ncbi:unnamed protein product [Effrenium voratum]|nr:unnamed protein product [Effrenium voratum]
MGKKGKTDEPERAPIDFDRIDGEKLVEKSLFKLRWASEPMIRSLKLEPSPASTAATAGGVPAFTTTASSAASTGTLEPHVFDTAKLGTVVAKSGWANFKLTEGRLPTIQDKHAGRRVSGMLASSSMPSGISGSPGSSLELAGRPGLGLSGSDLRSRKNFKNGLDEDGNRMKRADQYFQLLMRAKQKRDEANRKEGEASEWERAEGAARVAFERLMGTVKHRKDEGSDASTDSEAEEPVGEEDYGPLTAYDGQMKVDIDFVVVVPHREEKEDDEEADLNLADLQDLLPDGPPDHAETPKSAVSGTSTPPLDFSDEMESLKVELKKAGKLDDAPKGIAQRAAAEERQGIQSEKKMPNVWDNPFPEWTLETGGSMYFIPDAERYSWCPSLPPPPPPSVLGRRRLRLKPRLPLTLSNHRYKDEHPNIFPPDPFRPSEDHYARWEKKILTYDLYRSCVESLAKMPPQEFQKDDYKHRLKFGSFMEEALKSSVAWKNWRRKERRRQKDEEARKAKERAKEAQRKAEKERKLREAEEALRVDEDD